MSNVSVRRSAEVGAVVIDLVQRIRATSPAPPKRHADLSPELRALAAAAVGIGVRHWAARGSRYPKVVIMPGMYASSAEGERARHWVRRSLVGAALVTGYSRTRQVLKDNDQSRSGA